MSANIPTRPDGPKLEGRMGFTSQRTVGGLYYVVVSRRRPHRREAFFTHLGDAQAFISATERKKPQSREAPE